MFTKAALSALCATVLSATIANAEPFTYQGSLNDNGAPATGEYDLIFRLYDAANAGTQLGVQVVHENTPVTDGLFTVELDFGDDLFLMAPRYLEVRVRPGASGGSFDILSPRTTINPAPAAHHATNATFATTADALTNPIWNESGSVITAGNGLSRVFINRDTSISGSEFFGVHANTTGFVGMYISGPAGSFPFYGYSVDGDINAYSYFNASDNSLNFVGSGLITALRITSNSDVEVARDIQAESFQFETPKVSYHSISGEIFHSASSDTFIASSGTGGAYITNPGSGFLVAPVTLPHGATITRMRVYANDTFAGGDMTITLHQQAHGGSAFNSVASVDTSGLVGTNLELIDNTISFPSVNNNTGHYHIRVFSSSWPGTLDLRIKSVVIEYTTTEAD
ncbi:MAG: hypothetical protein R3B46_15315 [Phycisphaerales bacterium]